MRSTPSFLKVDVDLQSPSPLDGLADALGSETSTWASRAALSRALGWTAASIALVAGMLVLDVAGLYGDRPRAP